MHLWLDKQSFERRIDGNKSDFSEDMNNKMQGFYLEQYTLMLRSGTVPKNVPGGRCNGIINWIVIYFQLTLNYHIPFSQNLVFIRNNC